MVYYYWSRTRIIVIDLARCIYYVLINTTSFADDYRDCGSPGLLINYDNKRRSLSDLFGYYEYYIIM